METANETNQNAQYRVIVVDDNDVLRSLLRAILRDQGFQLVGEGKTGIAALELTQRHHPHIVCLDIEMPEMDGLKALREIKRTAAETRVIMITGKADTANVRESIKGGASGFIVKPFNQGKVVDTLKGIVSDLRQQEAIARKHSASPSPPEDAGNNSQEIPGNQ